MHIQTKKSYLISFDARAAFNICFGFLKDLPRLTLGDGADKELLLPCSSKKHNQLTKLLQYMSRFLKVTTDSDPTT